MPVNIADAFHRIGSSGVSARTVGFVRVGLGSAAMLRGIEAARILFPLTDPEVVRFPWFSWLPELTETLVAIIVVGWLAAAASFTAGLWTRVSGALLTLVMATSIALDQQAYSNHLYLLTVLIGLLIFTEPGAALSVDARQRDIAQTTVPAWPIFLMKLQVSVVYGFAALTKLNDTFLSGRVLAGSLGRGPLAPPESWLVPDVLAPLAILAVATELSVGIFLWRRRGRRIAVLLGIGLHVTIALLMTPTVQLIVFAMVMLSSYGLFFSAPQQRILTSRTHDGSPVREDAPRHTMTKAA